ncbi:serpentine type 7TM GPCR chemoreceptor srsx domain-containing protein [Ditylenchus destructor]|nr:serpentine type 7TM GPCR chemoreceptor srsx domain-containing protein [Ditylenchus destructor]
MADGPRSEMRAKGAHPGPVRAPLVEIYRLINKWIYIGTTMFAAMAYAGWGLYEIYKLAVVQPNRMVIPFVGEAEHDFLMIFFSNIVMFNLITLLCYFAIWIILKMRKNFRDTSMKKIVKSLIMISLVVFFGWTVCSSVQLIIGFVFHMPEIPFTFLNVYFGVTVHGSLSVNYVILYKFRRVVLPVIYYRNPYIS